LDANDTLIVWGGTHNGYADLETNNYEAFRLSLNSLPPTGTWDFNVNNAATSPANRVYQGPTGQPAYFDNYPRMFGLTDGQQFYSGFHPHSVKRLHPTSSSAPLPPWDTSAGNGGGWAHSRFYGSVFPLPNPNPGASNWIVRTGGYQAVVPYGTPTNTVDVCNAGVAGAWISWYPMNDPRAEHNTVLLPDGKVLVLGGRSANVHVYDCPAIQQPNGPAVRTAEILSAAGWVKVAAHSSPRVYHSAALLLPDARVLLGGGECRTWDYEVYKPPYLTNGKPRPTGVQVSQQSVTYETEYSARPSRNQRDAKEAAGRLGRAVVSRKS